MPETPHYLVYSNDCQFGSIRQRHLSTRESPRMRFTSSLKSFQSVAFLKFKHCSMHVRRLAMVLSRPSKVDRRPFLTFSKPLFSRRPTTWCPWLSARRQHVKLLNNSDVPRRKPLVMLDFFLYSTLLVSRLALREGGGGGGGEWSTYPRIYIQGMDKSTFLNRRSTYPRYGKKVDLF